MTPEIWQECGEWISVKDRLPELGKHVLVYGGPVNHPCTNREMIESYFYKMSNCNIIKCGREDTFWKPTHWRPLPKPPALTMKDLEEI